MKLFDAQMNEVEYRDAEELELLLNDGCEYVLVEDSLEYPALQREFNLYLGVNIYCRLNDAYVSESILQDILDDINDFKILKSELI